MHGGERGAGGQRRAREIVKRRAREPGRRGERRREVDVGDGPGASHAASLAPQAAHGKRFLVSKRRA
ncbi:MAG: hypothetical protein ACFCUS_10200 [Rubrimonas sp.]